MMAQKNAFQSRLVPASRDDKKTLGIPGRDAQYAGRKE
jgi:hypothetical protein